MSNGSDPPHPGGGQPRDGLFRFVFGNPVHAASELRSVLPVQLLERLDLERLCPAPGSFVDAALRQRHADALFTTRWSGRDAYLYVLLEHQSSPDPLMAFRMLRYQVRIWERHLERNPEANRLPVIVPVVIYQGRRRWTASTEFADLLDIDPDVRDLDRVILPRFSYLLDDLSGAEDTVLRSRPLTEEVRVGLALLGLPSGLRDLDEALGRWLDSLAIIASRPGGREVLAAFAAYVWKISDTPEQRMREFMATVEPEVAEPFVSTWGFNATRAQAELLASQLALRFGDLDETVEATVLAASKEQITAWSARLIGGTLTLADITG